MKLKSKLQQKIDDASKVEIELGNEKKVQVNVNLAFTDLAQLVLGGLIVALGVSIFIAPNDIAPGGASGTAIILQNFINVPIGILMLIFNIPAFFLGYKKLGGTSFLIRSLIGTLVYNLLVDVVPIVIPVGNVTDKMMLNAIFGGIMTGVGGGLIYRAGGVAGAGGVINLILRDKIGWPIKTTTLITNGLILVAAGLVFGWEAAMFAVIAFFVSGSVADFVLEGPDVIQTALIVTDNPECISRALTKELKRGVTRWHVEGKHRSNPHAAVFCTVTRPQLNELKNIVAAIDDEAFVITSQGHEAIGKGFRPHKWRPPVIQDVDEEQV
jgi:uncharacterized membrane-anchored protein YitT (DUF2179 family)